MPRCLIACCQQRRSTSPARHAPKMPMCFATFTAFASIVYSVAPLVLSIPSFRHRDIPLQPFAAWIPAGLQDVGRTARRKPDVDGRVAWALHCKAPIVNLVSKRGSSISLVAHGVDAFRSVHLPSRFGRRSGLSCRRESPRGAARGVKDSLMDRHARHGSDRSSVTGWTGAIPGSRLVDQYCGQDTVEALMILASQPAR